MPIAKTRYPLTRKMLDGAPKDMGVYVLWRDQAVLQPIVRELELLEEQEKAMGELLPCNLHRA